MALLQEHQCLAVNSETRKKKLSLKLSAPKFYKLTQCHVAYCLRRATEARTTHQTSGRPTSVSTSTMICDAMLSTQKLPPPATLRYTRSQGRISDKISMKRTEMSMIFRCKLTTCKKCQELHALTKKTDTACIYEIDI